MGLNRNWKKCTLYCVLMTTVQLYEVVSSSCTLETDHVWRGRESAVLIGALPIQGKLLIDAVCCNVYTASHRREENKTWTWHGQVASSTWHVDIVLPSSCTLYTVCNMNVLGVVLYWLFLYFPLPAILVWVRIYSRTCRSYVLFSCYYCFSPPDVFK